MKRDVRMQVLLTARHRRMLEELARRQGRSMNDAVRLAIENAYQRELLKVTAAGGGSVRVLGKGFSG